MANPTAAEVINEIIANAMTTADDATKNASDMASILFQTQSGGYMPPPAIVTDFKMTAIEPRIPEVVDTTMAYEVQLANLVSLLSGQLGEFFKLYYPLKSDAFAPAQTWLINTITDGGTGINAAVEAALWQRARERVITDGRRVQAQIVTGFAAKGYFLPAGAMTKKIEESLYEQAGKIGEASTAIAAKQLDAELEMVRFAIGQAIASRTMAMNAAADYIRAVATAPASAVNFAMLNADAPAKMMAAAATWYGARLDRDKIVLSSKLANMSSGIDVYKTDKTYYAEDFRSRVQALSAAADVYAKEAQAALMSLNSIVSTTASTFS